MLGPDIFNMALALRRQMNAEMRHVALASARGIRETKLPRRLAHARYGLRQQTHGCFHNAHYEKVYGGCTTVNVWLELHFISHKIITFARLNV